MMKSDPIQKNARLVLCLIALAISVNLSEAADSLFSTTSSPQSTDSSLAADTAAMADAAAAVSSAPPVSVTPQASPSDPSASNAALPPGSGTLQVPAPDSQQVTASASSNDSSTTAPAASTNSTDSVDSSQPKPDTAKSSTAVESTTSATLCTVAPTIKPPPVDEPPNMDQSPDKMAATAPTPPSENVTLNLINRLVQRGILTKEDAGDLIRQAQEDAKNAAQQAQVTQQAVTQAATAQQMAVEAAAPPQSDDQVSVSYVPEIVKAEMKDEIKRDVMAAAQAEGWNQPNIPEWLSKFRPFMDFRFRYEGDYFPSSNSTNYVWGEKPNGDPIFNGNLVNFNAINSGNPYNVSQLQNLQYPNQYPPTYNTTQNRERMRIRFRFGADMNLGDNFTSGFRIGTGQNGSPVSENQTFGFVGNQGNAQGGNFSSYAIWLDRAFLKYEIGDNPDKMAAITFGRFDNPFYTPTTIMWANDIGFDGIAAQARYKVFKGFTPFATIGLFPVYNTDLNFAATQQPKFASNDKYLYAGQTGIDWKVTKDLSFKGSAGYYFFQNVEGKVSAPQVAYGPETQFSTDDTRPTFAQKGNTYMELRNIQAVAANNFGQIDQFQYFGLATPFNILSANARLEYRHWEPFVVSISGEWDQNTAWNASSIQNCGPSNQDNPFNEPGPQNNMNSSGQYDGGNNAWIAQFKIGSGALQKRWDWDFGVSYRYVESDAVIDGFCDSDFGGGGTNLKGWAVGGNLALSRNVFIGARWFNANSIAGPQINSNILQIDLNARF
jgi:hypothetical protein